MSSLFGFLRVACALAFLLALLGFPRPAGASGITFGENGARAFSQGGAFVAQADDLTAVAHNPAGLALQDGTRLHLDVHLVTQQVSFTRQDAPDRPAAVTVSNPGSPFPLPFVAVSQGFKLLERPLTLALGLYGPPAGGVMSDPAPNYTRTVYDEWERSPNKYSAQRYILIDASALLFYPSLAVSYQPVSWLSVGVSLQYVYGTFRFKQAVYDGLTTPASQMQENPTYDTLVSVSLVTRPAWTAVLGALVKPTRWLAVGASLRPYVPLVFEGQFNVELSEFARKVGAEISGDRAHLPVTLPLEARLGAQVRPIDSVGIEADVVYERWSSFDSFVLTPDGVTISMMGGEPATIEPFSLARKWHDTWSLRLGGNWSPMPRLSLRAGALWEQAAAPESYTTLDFTQPTRTFFTAGAGWSFDHVELVLGGAYTPTQTWSVWDSQVRMSTTQQGLAGSVVGNGTFSSGGWILMSGLHGKFGGGKP